jgi:hypothetical protein
MTTKTETRARNLADGKLRPSWWSRPEPIYFNSAERAKRRAKGKAAKAARKANR